MMAACKRCPRQREPSLHYCPVWLGPGQACTASYAAAGSPYTRIVHRDAIPVRYGASLGHSGRLHCLRVKGAWMHLSPFRSALRHPVPLTQAIRFQQGGPPAQSVPLSAFPSSCAKCSAGLELVLSSCRPRCWRGLAPTHAHNSVMLVQNAAKGKNGTSALADLELSIRSALFRVEDEFCRRPFTLLRNDVSHRLLLPHVVWGQQVVQQGSAGAFVMS